MVDRPSRRSPSQQSRAEALIALVGGGLFTVSLFFLYGGVTDVFRLFVPVEAEAWSKVFTLAVAAVWLTWAFAWLAGDRRRAAAERDGP